jgi:hypothetical protein
MAFHSNSNGEKDSCPLHHQFVKHQMHPRFLGLALRSPWLPSAMGEISFLLSGLADIDNGASLPRSGAPTTLVVARLAERVAQPLETLVQTVTGSRASRLDVLLKPLAPWHPFFWRAVSTYPGTLSEAVEAKLVSDLSSVHGVLKRGVSCMLVPGLRQVMCLRADPACWRRPGGEHRAARPRSAYAEAPHAPQRHGRDRCCQRRR